jgi:hypothetical protein
MTGRRAGFPALKQYVIHRGKIYQQELKQLLTALSHFFTLFVFVLNLAIPALILTALVSLSVIADPKTSLAQRCIYQGLYFLLLYLMIRLQKLAILGQGYQLYLASLPVSGSVRIFATVLLTLAAGNLPLLTPILLLGYVQDWHSLADHLYFVLFALNGLLIAWVGINRQCFPWLSLLVLPLLAGLTLTESSLPANVLNTLWLTLVAFEAYFQPFNLLNKHTWPLKHYWQIRWLSIFNNPVNLLSRIFVGLFFITLVAYVQHKMAQVASGQLQVLSCCALALIIGSYQFDNERFYLTYPHYLGALVDSPKRCYWLDTLPAMFTALVMAMLCVLLLHFSPWLILILPALSLFTCVCVTKLLQVFFIPPALLTGVLMFVAN